MNLYFKTDFLLGVKTKSIVFYHQDFKNSIVNYQTNYGKIEYIAGIRFVHCYFSKNYLTYELGRDLEQKQFWKCLKRKGII